MHDISSIILNRAGDKARGAVNLAVQRTLAHSKELATVLFTVGDERISSKEFDRRVSVAFQNKVTVLPGSAIAPAPGMVLAMLSPTQESRPYADTASFEGLIPISAQIYRDPDNVIWRKVGEGDLARLVKESHDDLSAILTTRRAFAIDTASVAVPLSEPCAVGQLACWYDPHAGHHRFGFVTAVSAEHATASAFCPPAEVSEKPCLAVFQPSWVVAVLDDARISQQEMAGLAPAIFGKEATPLSRDNMLQKHLAYMAVLYGKRPEYYNRLVSMIKQRFGASALH